MIENFLSFGGIEVVNSRRASVLSKAGGGWLIGPSYPELETAFGVTYTDPTATPWYDVDMASVCARFYGVYGLKMENVYDSTRVVVVNENSGDGGVIGTPRKGTRSIKVTVTLMSTGRDAMEYGRAWLASVLELAGCTQGNDCGRGDVLFFAESPTSSADALAKTRLLKYATVTSGPFAVNEYGSRGLYNTDVEFTFTSERPYLYSVTSGIDLTLNPALALIQDSPINWIPYPSAELERTAITSPGYTRPIIARNVNQNISQEVASTGWTATGTTTTGSTLATYVSGSNDMGAASLGTHAWMSRVLGNGATAASGTGTLIATSPTVDVQVIPALRLLKIAAWAETAVVSGTGQAIAATPTLVAQFVDSTGTNVGGAVSMTADSHGIGLYSTARVLVPATAVGVKVQASAAVTWSSGATDAANGDLRLYVDGVSVTFEGV
jgi:hypothetical protein